MAPIAPPVLASTLLEQESKRYRSLLQDAGDGSTAGYKLQSGVEELDDYVLLGGFERGEVVGFSGLVGGVGGGLGVNRGGMGKGIAAEALDGLGSGMGDVGRLLSLHILTSTLLSDPKTLGTIIDTTGSFPLSLLAKVIKYRISRSKAKEKHKARNHTQNESRHHQHREQRQEFTAATPAEIELLNEEVRSVLQRVSISRVFDVEGVWEVLGEVFSSPDPGAQSETDQEEEFINSRTEVETGKVDAGEVVASHTATTSNQPMALPDHAAGPKDEEENEQPAQIALEIPDSESDSDNDGFDEDPDLPSSGGTTREERPKSISKELPKAGDAATTQTAHPRNSPTLSPRRLSPDAAVGEGLGVTSDRIESKQTQRGKNRNRTGIIIVDNMTTIITSFLARTERVAAHTRLQALSRTLRTLTREHSILTILLNTTTTTTSGANIENRNDTVPRSGRRETTASTTTSNPAAVSIFHSSTTKPSLGLIFEDFISLHLQLSLVPAGREDAERLFGGEGRASQDEAGDGDRDREREREQGQDDNTEELEHASPKVRYGIVVEVLRDDVSAISSWHADAHPASTAGQAPAQPARLPKAHLTNRREQRWCALEVETETETENTYAYASVGGAGPGAGYGSVSAAESGGIAGGVAMRALRLFPTDSGRAAGNGNGNGNGYVDVGFGRRA